MRKSIDPIHNVLKQLFPAEILADVTPRRVWYAYGPAPGRNGILTIA